MKSAVETLSPTRAKLTVEVPFEELKPSLDAAYKKIAQQINVPGFRKGKVPPMVIDRQVGRAAVLDEAINNALPQLYVQALQEADLQPLAQPEIEITKFEDNETLEFSAEVDVRPEITLPEYDGLEVTVDDVAVTDEDVEEQVKNLRERFATLNEVEREAADGDFVVIDLKASKDGEVVEGAEVSGMSYQIGRGGMLDGLDEALAGMKAGDEKTFSSQLVGGDALGEDVDVEVKVSAVKEQELPELDDDFAQTASEFDTVAELTEDVRTRLQRGKRLEQAAAARDAVLEKVLDLVEIPLPDAVVDSELQARRENIEQQLMYAGMTMEQYLESEGQTAEEFETDLAQRVRDAVAAQFILDEVAKKEEIGVEQQELSEHLFRRAQQSGQDPNEFAKHMVEHNHIPEMVSEVVRGKALATIVESAKVTDESGNHVELKNLQPDGSIAEPSAETAESTEDDAEKSAES
ncbi:trigger factor [Nocardioides sp. WL0053]|uniref:Trigger factor n=1 Tax=Nocardioides jiangsuensis TaxID=2866161 RepID=A0ABS7RNR0_9ACTN|nr:trigger factor [Nocardioides jiangsuensis]MBY9076696.1 trigger factor [Nocardioides jiangsuensis]